MDHTTAQIVAAAFIIGACILVDLSKRVSGRMEWVSRNTTPAKTSVKWEQIAPYEECFDEQLDDL